MIPKKRWVRIPHALQRPASLWWYQTASPRFGSQPTPETQSIIQTYVAQCKRGRTLPDDFVDTLRFWLQELNAEQEVGPRKKRFWTIPAYVLSHKLEKGAFCKRFREMEKIAIRLFPDQVPPHRKPVTLTEKTKDDIRAKFKEVQDFPKVAAEFGIGAFLVGQICKAEKAQIIEQRETAAMAEREIADNGNAVPDNSF